jgi:hypothetical protein
LLGWLRSKSYAARVQVAAEVKQVGHKQRNAGMPPHQRLGLRMHRGMDTDMGVPFEKLRTEGSLLGERETESVPIKLDGTAYVVDEDGNTVQRRFHTFRIL